MASLFNGVITFQDSDYGIIEYDDGRVVDAETGNILVPPFGETENGYVSQDNQ